MADEYNETRLAALPDEVKSYLAADWYSEEAREDGDGLKTFNASLIKPSLDIKINAQVMLLKNLDLANGLANGSMGIVVEYDKDNLPVVRFTNGVVRSIGRSETEVMQNGKLYAKRTQIPLRLAWATTIHKCQGMTFDRISCDLKRSFADGQVYVALSRTKTLEGLFVESFNPKKLTANPVALGFYNWVAHTKQISSNH